MHKWLSPIIRVDTSVVPKAILFFDSGNRCAVYGINLKFVRLDYLFTGFDGVEIHGGNGYLIEDFLKDSVNDRTDQYGPQSYENRTRFVLELYDAVAAEVGAERVGLRISLFSLFNNAYTSDPIPLGLYLIEQLNKRNVLYLHGVEPRIKGSYEIDSQVRSART